MTPSPSIWPTARVVGWFQGRMEFGPRSLGSRSLLGDPRDPEMQSTMNLKIKFRESFRPFAPAVLAERADDYFDMPRGLRQPLYAGRSPGDGRAARLVEDGDFGSSVRHRSS